MIEKNIFSLPFDEINVCYVHTQAEQNSIIDRNKKNAVTKGEGVCFGSAEREARKKRTASSILSM
jgi:hypothetical protein